MVYELRVFKQISLTVANIHEYGEKNKQVIISSDSLRHLARFMYAKEREYKHWGKITK